MGLLRNPETDDRQAPTALVETKYLRSLQGVVWERSRRIEGIPLDEQTVLPQPLKLAIRRSRLSVEILKRPSSNETKYDLFQRLNAGGTVANAQELRNVIVIMVSPEYYQFMRGLSRHDCIVRCWRQAKISSKSSGTWNTFAASLYTHTSITTVASMSRTSLTRVLLIWLGQEKRNERGGGLDAHSISYLRPTERTR